MSNWFKKSQFGEDVGAENIQPTPEIQPEPEFEQEQKAIRYRAVIPVDIWLSPTGDKEADQETAYNTLKDILSTGSETAMHEGFNDLLQLSDIQEYSQTNPF